jgi:hypothetical protein
MEAHKRKLKNRLHVIELMLSLTMLGLLISGCLGPPVERQVIMLTISSPLSFSEVVSINYTYAKEQLSTLGYHFINYSDSPPEYNYRDYSAGKDSLSITMYAKSSAPTANLLVIYTRIFSEKSLEEKKKYLKMEVGNVTSLCNITMDWTKAQWVVSYED